MGDEEGGEEGEESDHYESMVFNLLTGNTQGYQVCTNKSIWQNIFSLHFCPWKDIVYRVPWWWLQMRSDLRLFFLNSDQEFSQPWG
jgi:hypothetical protein